MMLECRLKADRLTINLWVIKYDPLLEEAFRKRHKRPVGISWCMEATFIKVKANGPICIKLPEQRDEPIARAFFEGYRFKRLSRQSYYGKSNANKAGIDTIHVQLVLFLCWEAYLCN
ncbi:TPA: hypothetical protein ACPSKB_000695 [Legionella feeleii]